MANGKPQVSVLMGSKSDWDIMKKAVDVLEELGVGVEAKVISAHRRPGRLHEYVKSAEDNGVKVFIAGAGLAAHLPGVTASLTTRPVLGVPVDAGPLKGQDALYSIVQMPPGIPVASLGIGSSGAKNAGILAAQIIGTSDESVAENVRKHRADQAATLAKSENPAD